MTLYKRALFGNERKIKKTRKEHDLPVKEYQKTRKEHALPEFPDLEPNLETEMCTYDHTTRLRRGQHIHIHK